MALRKVFMAVIGAATRLVAPVAAQAKVIKVEG
jgi:hypothetical protein